jgi:5-methylcytosine-specific restriction endonuclease McrA
VPVLADRICVKCDVVYAPHRRDQRWCTTECKNSPSRGPGRGRVRKAAPQGMVACSKCDFVGSEDTWPCRNSTYKGVTRSVLHSWCVNCRRLDKVKRYWSDPEKYRSASLSWVSENREYASLVRRAYDYRKKSAVNIPYTHDELAARLSMFGFRCWMCSKPATTVDHVKPLARGGYNCLSNLRPACKSCNCSKRHRWPFDTRLWCLVGRAGSDQLRAAS